MKNNKQRIIWARMFAGRSTYQEAKFDEDADKVVEYYRDQGYITARVGAPELKVVSDSDDKKTRLVDLRIPITEGNRYRVGDFGFDGNTVVKSDDLRPFFKVDQGQFYSEKAIRKGLEKTREVYGAGGYFEFTGYPDYKFRDLPDPAEPQTPAALKAEAPTPSGPPIVDVTMKLVEGKQFFINRLTFTGNTTTRDNVIRREVRLFEEGVFNTEALKYSIKRLNQLGYFKPLEGGKDVDVQKTPGQDNKVDIKLKLEEQNRNQLTFGAGVSEFEGFFGQMSFSTSNFLGRGESLTLSAQSGSRAQNYQLAFTEPFLFDRNITGGFDLFRRDIRYIGQFTQQSKGGVLSFGFPLAGFTRLFTNYSYEQVRVTEISDVYTDPLVLARNPYLRDSLLIGQGGERVISKVVPSLVHNTVDNPITPTTGTPLLAVDRSGRSGRQHELLQADARGRLVPQTEQPHVARLPRAVRVHPHVQRLEGTADLREAVPGRRVQHPRIRHPHRRAAGSADRARPRRQQERAVQHRGADQHRRSGPPRAVLRRRAGAAGARRRWGRRRSRRPVSSSARRCSRARASTSGTSRRPRAPRSASSCRC